jgi:hypothetical protein
MKTENSYNQHRFFISKAALQEPEAYIGGLLTRDDSLSDSDALISP